MMLAGQDLPDSLQAALSGLKRNERVDKLAETARIYQHQGQGDLAYMAIDEAIRLSQGLDDKNSLAKALSTKGILLTLDGDFENSLKYFRYSLKYRQPTDSSSIGYTHRNMGVQHFSLGNNDSALSENFTALIYLPDRDTILKAITLLELAKVFYAIRIYPKSVSYGESAVELFEQLGDYVNIGSSYNSIGLSLLGMEKTRLARETLRKSWHYSLHYAGDSTNAVGNLLNIGLTHLMESNYDSAHDYLSTAHRYYRRNPHHAISLMHAKVNLGVCLKEMGRLKEAKPLLLDALGQAREIGYANVIEKASGALSDVAEKEGDFVKALAYEKEHAAAIEDNILVENSASLQSLERELEYSLKERKLAQLETENQVQRDRIRVNNRERGIFIAGIIVLILFIVPLFILNRKIRLQNRLLSEQKEQIEIQRAGLDTMNRTKDRYFSIIGHDLRGPIGNILGLLNFIPNKNDTLTEETQEILNISRNGLREVHNLLENLLIWAKGQSNELMIRKEEQLFEPLVAQCCELLAPLVQERKTKIVKDVQPGLIGYFDHDAMYTVLRNLSSNAIKYSPEGSTVTIRAFEADGEMVMQVIDEGPGLDQELFNMLNSNRDFTRKGLGLKLTKTLTEQMDGTLRVENGEPGTRITVFLPSRK